MTTTRFLERYWKKQIQLFRRLVSTSMETYNAKIALQEMSLLKWKIDLPYDCLAEQSARQRYNKLEAKRLRLKRAYMQF